MKRNFTKLAATLSVLMLFIIPARSQTVREPVMVPVKGGSFIMGTNSGVRDEAPPHKVTLCDYFIGKYEISYAEFKNFVDATGYVTDAEQPDSVRMKQGLASKNVRNGSWKAYANGTPVPVSDTDKPVGNISWFDAMAYCKWLSGKTGKNYSLPTEAEWEFAARGGAFSKGYKYSGSNSIDEVAWYAGNAEYKAHKCGQLKANELGIYDMSGNIREWCADWYGEYYYKESPEYSPKGPDRGRVRVIRGGAWGTQAQSMSDFYRNNELPYNSSLDIGFRIAIAGKQAEPPKPPEPEPVKKDTGLFKDFDATGMVDIYGIYFDSGKSVVKPESYPVIVQIAAFLNEHPKIRVEIEGHTDNTGSAQVNQSLSEKRAENIRTEIIKKGIDPSRLEAKGYGSSKPVADNKTAAGRTQNRRVTIKKL